MPKPVTRSRSDRLNALLARLYIARPHRLALDQPIISFCFDDFPQSAIDNGARLLTEAGHRGTFYLSTSLEGYEDEAGRYAGFDAVRKLIAEGHDIGCHTHGHIDLLHGTKRELMADLERYREIAASEFGGDAWPTTFAYPYGRINLRNKSFLSRQFDLARGIRAGINSDLIDLAHLKANELSSPETIDRAHSLIDANRREKGFLIFFTHDVQPEPSTYGCRPEDLKSVVTAAMESGAWIATMDEIAGKLTGHGRSSRAAARWRDRHPHRTPAITAAQSFFRSDRII